MQQRGSVNTGSHKIQRQENQASSGVCFFSGMAWMMIFILLVGTTTSVWAQAGPFGGGAGGGPGGPGNRGGSSGEIVGTVGISQQSLTTTVAGRLRPLNTVSHQVSANGFVSELYVELGSPVQVGAPLFALERDEIGGGYVPVVVRARISGVVSAIHINLNNEVRTGENGVTVIDTREYTLTAQISDKDAFKVQPGMSVTGVSTSRAILTGELTGRSPEPDYQTGLYTLTFRFSDNSRGSQSNYLGQFLTIELPTETVQGIFVSQDLLFRQYGRYYVWTVTEDDTLTARLVTLGLTYGTQVQITSGLSAGERYLLVRRGNEREGMAIPGRG
jgi:multidrug efflux pump subunit AcrA (membrane-fusion protein)